MPRFLTPACLLAVLAAVPACTVLEDALERFGRSDGEFDTGPLFATSLGSRIGLNVLTPDNKIALLGTFSSGLDISEDAISPGRSWVHYGDSTISMVRDTALSNDAVRIFQVDPGTEIAFGAVSADLCDLSALEASATTTAERMLQERLGINMAPPFEVKVTLLVTNATVELDTGGLNWIGWLSDSELVVSAFAGIFVDVTYGARLSESFDYFQTLSDLQYLTIRHTGGGEDGWETVACSPRQPTIPPFGGPASILSLEGTQLMINGSPAIVARTEDIVYAEPIRQVSREVARRVRPGP